MILALRGAIEKEEFDLLIDGIKRIDPFILKGHYVIEDAIVDASKAAYAASMIKAKRSDVKLYSGNPEDDKDIQKLLEYAAKMRISTTMTKYLEISL